MLQHKTVTQITEAVNSLSPLLYEAQSDAMSGAAASCHNFPIEDYAWFWSMATRAHMRQAIARIGLPEGWYLAGNPRLSGQLVLVSEGLNLRYIKEVDPVFPGGVPAAGHNAARRTYWAPIFPLFAEDSCANSPLNLLLLWDRKGNVANDAQFSLRVVHTIGEGRYGTSTPIDLSMTITPEAGDVADLEFATFPENQEFFATLEDLGEDDGEHIA